METNKQITLYHYNEDVDAYTVISYSAHVKRFTGIISDKNGFKSGNGTKIRIPTKARIIIGTNDYVRIGVFSDERPDKTECIKVVGFSDNRRGTQPHWRIDAV